MKAIKCQCLVPSCITVLPLLCSLLFLSCSKDEGEQTKVQISISTSSTQILESSKEGITVTAKLEKETPSSGSVSISLSGTADYGKDYTTTPNAKDKLVTILFSKGEKEKSITINPIDNDKVDEHRKIIFEITKLPPAFKFSDNKIVAVTIQDDDEKKVTEPIKVDISTSSGEVMENAKEGVTITTKLSKETTIDKILEITLSGDARYDTDYTTDPTVNDKKISLSFSKGDKEKSIILKPKDNAKVDKDKKVKFTITKVPEGIELGSKKEVEITIKNDDKDTKPKAILVDIKASSETVSENDKDGITLTMMLSKPAIKDGVVAVVEISGTAQFGTDYATIPNVQSIVKNGRLPIVFQKGETELSILIKPIDNTKTDGNRTIKIKMVQVQESYEMGANKELTITITDDEKSTGDTKLSATSILGTWKVISGFSTTREWKDGKVVVLIKRTPLDSQSPNLKYKYIFKKAGKLVIDQGNRITNTSYTLDIKGKTITAINGAYKVKITKFDGKEMFIVEAKPTQKTDFWDDGNGGWIHHQYEYLMKKQ